MDLDECEPYKSQQASRMGFRILHTAQSQYQLEQRHGVEVVLRGVH